mgnify:CR=1 FL=1
MRFFLLRKQFQGYGYGQGENLWQSEVARQVGLGQFKKATVSLYKIDHK